MECIAHRGFADEHPENTVPAVRAAASAADWIEIDVRRCGSGELVVVHDATVDRVTDSSGRVADMTAGELAALDVCGSGMGVPTLSSVLDGLPSDVGVDVELKERGLAADATRLLADCDGPVLATSFDPEALAGVRTAGNLPLGLIGSTDVDSLLDRAASLDCTAVCVHHECCEASTVRRAHDDGLSVYAWTIRDRVVAERCGDAGVDGLVADSPAYCPGG